MKKKLKDITIGDMKHACNNHDCDECPFKDFEYCDFMFELNDDALMQEYDVSEAE